MSITPQEILEGIRDDLAEANQERDRIEARCLHLESALEEVEKRMRGKGGPYAGTMTQLEAAHRCLLDHGKGMGTAQLVKALMDGGFKHNAKKKSTFYNGLYGTLTEAAKDSEKTGIKKVEKEWFAISQAAAAVAARLPTARDP